MVLLEWVNHASYVLQQGKTSLLYDPWLDGAAFDFGWDLLVPSSFEPDRFDSVTHIWFSHEHPDHFSPASLKTIPPAARARITIIYQESADRRVVKFCQSIGFKEILELKPTRWVRLGPGIEIRCVPHDNGDSWLAARTPKGTVLNLNDCVITSRSECQKILREVGPVHVLATQFSYANWVGNPGDDRSMAAAAAEKLSWMKTQIDTLRPSYVLPFASFVYFSHEDNFFLNSGMTTVDKAVEFIRRETSVPLAVLFPGDRWDLAAGAPPDVSSVLARYGQARERVLSEGSKHRSQKVPIETVILHGDQFVKRLRARNGPLLCLLLPTLIHLEDHNATVRLSPSGVGVTLAPREICDLACKSDALDYCFLYEWGGRTLDINARFQVPARGHYWKFKTWATLASFNNRGEGMRQVLTTVLRRIRKRLV
jgi:UDP-MurNAc hydroxylase